MVSGGFFALGLGDGGRGVGWRPFSELLAPDGRALGSELARYRLILARTSRLRPSEVEERVAASLWFMGWSARLLSPWLGAAVRSHVVPLGSADRLLWRGSAQPVALALVGRPQWQPATARTVYDACLATLVEPLLSRTARTFHVSQRVLWGNVASAAAGAVTVLGSVATADAARARDLVSDLLASRDLRGQGEWTGETYLRFSCCLRYRLPAADLCGDCILLTR